VGALCRSSGLYPTGHCTNHTQAADLGLEGVVPVGREFPVLACLDNIVTIIEALTCHLAEVPAVFSDGVSSLL
jgi:hypothetical protein